MAQVRQCAILELREGGPSTLRFGVLRLSHTAGLIYGACASRGRLAESAEREDRRGP